MLIIGRHLQHPLPCLDAAFGRSGKQHQQQLNSRYLPFFIFLFFFLLSFPAWEQELSILYLYCLSLLKNDLIPPPVPVLIIGQKLDCDLQRQLQMYLLLTSILARLGMPCVPL